MTAHGIIEPIIMVDTKQINLFMSLFKGRTDVYARRWEKNGKNGYSPAYELNWK